jgi:hypothetical protein
MKVKGSSSPPPRAGLGDRPNGINDFMSMAVPPQLVLSRPSLSIGARNRNRDRQLATIR